MANVREGRLLDLLARLQPLTEEFPEWSNRRWRERERPLDDDGSPRVGDFSMTAGGVRATRKPHLL